MERRHEVGGSNSTFRNSNEAIASDTRPLINQLDVPVSSNVDELVNIAEEQNDFDRICGFTYQSMDQVP